MSENYEELLANDNPAARLHNILYRAKNMKVERTTNKTVLARVLNAEKSSNSLLLSRISKVLAMPQQIRFATEQIVGPVRVDAHMAWVPNFSRLFFPLSLSDPWDAAKCDADMLSRLQMTSDTLSVRSKEKELFSGDFDRILQDLESFKSMILASDIAQNIKQSLIFHLDEIIQRCDEYDFFGGSGIESATLEAIGNAFKMATVDPSIRDKDFFKSMMDGLGNIVTVVGAYDIAVRLTSTVQTILPSLMN